MNKESMGESVYDEEEIEVMLDEDEITSEEEGFMKGYNEAAYKEE